LDEKSKLLDKYMRSNYEINRIKGERDAKTSRLEEEQGEMEDEFDKAIRLLKDTKTEKRRTLGKKIEEIEEKAEEELDSWFLIRENVKRIRALLSVNTTMDLQIADDAVYNVSKWHPFFEMLDYIVDENHLKIRLCIIENERPKNKFSLFGVGKCHFPDELFYHDRGFCVALCSNDRGVTILRELKHLPSVEALKNYVDENQALLKKRLVKNYFDVVGEYQQAHEQFKLEDFDEEVPLVPEVAAPLIFEFVHDDKPNILVRRFNGWFYQSVESVDEKTSDNDLIEVNDAVFEKWCTVLYVTDNGNKIFGSWWSMNVESGHANKKSRRFTKPNFDRLFYEAKAYFESKKVGDKGHFRYPRLKWHHPELLEVE